MITMSQVKTNEILTLLRISDDLSLNRLKLNIDNTTSILIAYYDKKILIEGECFELSNKYLVAEKVLQVINHKMEVPSLEVLCSKLVVEQSGFYLTQIEKTLPVILNYICRNSKEMRKLAGHILGVLNFSTNMETVLVTLQQFIKVNLENLQNIDKKSIEEYCRRLDMATYLAFELSGKEISAHLKAIFTQVFHEMFSRKFPVLLSCRGFRHSFLKAMKLAEDELFIKVIKITNTEDSISFQIIYLILHIKDRNMKCYNENLINQIFLVSKNTLIKISRDLRRVVPSGLSINKNDVSKIINRFNIELEEQVSDPDTEVWMARCLILFYANYFDTRLLVWLSTNYIRINFSTNQRNTLLAFAGNDIPFVVSINKGLYSDGFKYKIIPPSRYQNIIQYMVANLKEWRDLAVVINSNNDMQVGTLPLVSVVITTFEPVLDLFKLSLESIIYQSYQNIEIIIIDDCTQGVKGNDLRGIVEYFQKHTDRTIIFHRNKKNIGQYKSRNDAILRSKGEFIAIQDDDDISHPERIYYQIQPMLFDTEIIATHAYHLRISENSRIMNDGNNIGQALGDAPVSFVWKRKVFQEIGSFLPTRSRGDIEFRNRIRRYYPIHAIKIIPHPLVLMRGGLGTISSEKEYFFNSALTALRYMMNHTPKTITELDMELWIPRNLK